MPKRLPTSHPRVLVRKADIPRLRRLAKSSHRREYDALVALAGAALPTDGDCAAIARRLAFLHLLTGKKAHADLAIAATRRILDLPVQATYFEATNRMRALSAVYDWCHAAIDPGTRQAIGHQALAYAHAVHVTGEICPGNFVAGHEVNQVPYILATCIAIGDELPGARALMDDALKRWASMQACYQHFLERDSFQQSYSYCAAYLPEIAMVFNLKEAAFGGDEYRKNPWYRNLVAWWTYAFRADETFIRYGDYFCAHPVLGNTAYWLPFAACAGRYRDALARWWVERFQIKESEPEAFIFEPQRERPVSARGPEELPRNKLFAGMGIAIARSWDDGTVAALKCSPVYLHNHCHRDQNSLTIFHKADQAIDSGAYDGYETGHWYDYYIRTIAHNTLVVHDPDERMVSRGRERANDGGQRFLNQPDWAPRTIADVRSPRWRDGDIAAWRDGGDWSYACGDASRCYDRKKLRRFRRHVVFVHDHPHPRAVSLLVIDDVVLARAGLIPRWLLHTMERPTVDGARIVARHGGGRLTTHVLSPAAPRVEVIGGPGEEFWSDGANRAMSGQLRGPHTPGAWRVEVAPSASATSTRFITWLCPADVDAPLE
nr:heparinase II/III family protein [Planctomycetota bacterium]